MCSMEHPRRPQHPRRLRRLRRPPTPASHKRCSTRRAWDSPCVLGGVCTRAHSCLPETMAETKQRFVSAPSTSTRSLVAMASCRSRWGSAVMLVWARSTRTPTAVAIRRCRGFDAPRCTGWCTAEEQTHRPSIRATSTPTHTRGRPACNATRGSPSEPSTTPCSRRVSTRTELSHNDPAPLPPWRFSLIRGAARA